MVGQRVSSRLCGRRAVRAGALVAAAFLVAGACGCSKRQRALGAIESEFAGGNYEEAIALCEREIRSDGADADVFRFLGLSLLAVDRDAEAVDWLRKAVGMNGAMAAGVSASLAAKAREALSLGRTGQAERRLRAALEIDPQLDAGPLEYLAADGLFEEKRWEDAARRYERALGENPDTTAAEKGYFNLAVCRAAAGDSASAIEVLEIQIAAFPRGALADRARWTLVNLLYERARGEFQRGSYERAAELAAGVVRRADAGPARQKARFLLGESYERMGRYASAYEQYQSLVREDRGASGRLVERARAKIRAIEDAGLR